MPWSNFVDWSDGYIVLVINFLCRHVLVLLNHGGVKASFSTFSAQCEDWAWAVRDFRYYGRRLNIVIEGSMIRASSFAE